jgi:hypothetical protein
MFASGRMQNLHPQDRHRVNPSRSNCVHLVTSALVHGSVSAITMYDVCIRKNVIASIIPGRTSWAVSAPLYDVCIRADAKSASADTSSRQPFQVVQVGSCRLRSASRLNVGWIESTARYQEPPCTMTLLASGGCKICIRKTVIASTIPDRTSGSCLLRSASRLVSSARVHGSVSAIIMYDACIRADAKSASARPSSGQPFQVEQDGRVCSDRPAGWCRRLPTLLRCNDGLRA